VSESILMGYAEVSELTGIPVFTLKDYRAKGSRGPRSAVIAGKVKYRRTDVLAWIDEQFEMSGKGGDAKPAVRFTPLGNRSLTNA
jgi:hypothetical protein